MKFLFERLKKQLSKNPSTLQCVKIHPKSGDILLLTVAMAITDCYYDEKEIE